MKKIFLFSILFLSFIFNYKNIFALQIIKVDNSQTSGGNPSSSQFIEFYNDSDNEIDISGAKLFDAGATKNGHGISSNNTETNFKIPAKNYFILSYNTSKEIFTACRVFKYTLEIGTNDNISFKKDSVELASFSVINQNSLSSTDCYLNSQNQDINSTTSSTTNIDNNNNSTTSSSTNSSSTNNTNSQVNNIVYVYLNNQNKYGDIDVLLPEYRIVPAGADVSYTVKAVDSNKKIIEGLDFNWSFGDGGEKFGKDVSYHYMYPGDYSLIATADGYTSGGQARMEVKVIDPKIEIVKVGTSSLENFIDIKNNTEYDLFLSDFYLEIDGQDYKLPKNFLIAKNKIVHISGEALNFHLPAINVSLLYPNKKVLVSYVKFITNNITDDVINNFVASSSVNIDSDLVISSTSLNIKEINSGNFEKNIENQINLKKKDLSEKNNSLIKEKESKNIFLKRLSLKDDKSLKNKEDSKDVDIGIVKWFKSLLY